MSRSARSLFTNVERPVERAYAAARSERIDRARRAKAAAALDQLVHGETADEALILYRCVVNEMPKRLGFTHSTATLLASRATDASLVATRAPLTHANEEGEGE